MAKAGEIDYLRNSSPEEVLYAANKPFSDDNCGNFLLNIGAVFSLLPRRPARLLDLGCGTGWTSLFFAKAGYDVVGVDIAPDMIAHAEQSRRHEGLANLRFLVCDYEELSFENQFDVVVFYDSLHHAVDEALAVRRAFEALRPGGRCVASEPGRGHHVSREAAEAVRRFGVTEKDMPPERIIELGRQAGFTTFRAYPHAWNNQLVDYRDHTLPGAAPRPRRSPFKQLVYWAASRCLRIEPRLCESFLPRLRRFRKLYQAGGIVCMVK